MGSEPCLPHFLNPKGLSRPDTRQTNPGPKLRFPHSTHVLLTPRMAVLSSLTGPQSTAGPSQGQSRALARCGGPWGCKDEPQPFPFWGDLSSLFHRPCVTSSLCRTSAQSHKVAVISPCFRGGDRGFVGGSVGRSWLALVPPDARGSPDVRLHQTLSSRGSCSFASRGLCAAVPAAARGHSSCE